MLTQKENKPQASPELGGGGLTFVSHDSTLTGLGTVGSPLSVVGGGGGSPAGSNTQIQFNDSNSFGASQYFTYDSGKFYAGSISLAAGSYIDQDKGISGFTVIKNSKIRIATADGDTVIGDALGSGSGTIIGADDSAQQVYLRANDSVLIQSSSNQTSASFVSGINPVVDLGDYAGLGHKNRFTLDDGAQSIQFTASSTFSILDTDIAQATWFKVDTGNQRTTAGDITQAYNKTLWYIDDPTKLILAQTDGKFQVYDTTMAHASWFIVDVGSMRVKSGDITGGNFKTVFDIDDPSQTTTANTDTFYLSNPFNGTQNYLQAHWNAGHPQINFGSAGGVGNSTNFYLDDGIMQIKLQAIHVNYPDIQPFANNAAALAGSLATGDVYYTNVAGDGILKVVI